MRHARFASSTSLNRLVAIYPGLLLDLPVGVRDAATLAECARRLGRPEEAVLADLAVSVRPQLPVDGRDWTQEPIADLLQHLVAFHHPFLVIELDRLTILLRRGDGPDAGWKARMQAWIAGKLQHIASEESELFPLCRGLDAREGVPEAVLAPLRAMYASHEHAGAALAALCEDLAAGIGDDAGTRLVAQAVHGIAGVLDDHVWLEDTVLLPVVVHAGEISRSRRLLAGRERLGQHVESWGAIW